MSEYVNRVALDVNGTTIEDFKTFTENEIELYKQVKLMNKTGHMPVTGRYGCKVDYVVPDETEFDWASVVGGRLTVEYDSGKRVTFTGVYTLKVGEGRIDGENETTKTIELGAEERTVE